MKVKRISTFKSTDQDKAWFNNWVKNLEEANGREYQRINVSTSLGKTHVWGLNTDADVSDTLVIFPGARTTSLIWDFDRGLDHLHHPLRIYMVETNGLPNLSDGSTPDIHSLDYGQWASEVLNKLNIKSAFVAGASFGGLICMKLAIYSPEKIKAAFLLNPGCLQPFSLSTKNLYYTLLPIFSPKSKNVARFLDKAVFCKPNHQLSAQAEKMLIDYEVFAISRYKDHTQKPYYMDKELGEVKTDTYLLEGDHDLLFPYERSIDNAKKYIRTLKDVRVFEQVGHGIETFGKAIQYIGDVIKTYS